MCDPISIAVAAVCCCCCIIMVVVVMASVLPALAVIAGVAQEVLTCVNETIGVELTEAMGMDDCKKAEEKGCWEDDEFKNEEDEFGSGAPAAFRRRLTATADDECKELNAKCVCKVAEQLAAIENPSLEKKLMPCCSPIQEYEDNAFIGDGAKAAHQLCNDLVVNVTKFVDELDENCSKGEMPNFENPHSILDGGAPVNTLDVGQKFSILEDAWQPGRHLAARVQPAVAGGAGLALLVAAASVLRRRLRAKTRRSAGALIEEDVEVE